LIDDINNALDDLNNELTQLQNVSDECLTNIKKVNDSMGFTERNDRIRNEIIKEGWATVYNRYLPANNTNDPAAIPIFELVKAIYRDCLIKGELCINNE
jgi:hypothetical protein